MNKKKIEFTYEQFLQLLRLVYLGKWMASSHLDDPDKSMEDFEQYIYSHAKDYEADKFVDFDTTYKTYFPSAMLEDEMAHIIQDYDDFTFWDELAWQLAERDFTKKFDKAQVLCMTNEEIFREKNTMADQYFDEFAENGIEHFIVNK
jgi:hypothetical protein